MVTSLVAGGAGFIGSHLCEHLLEKGHFVICIDNLISGRKENLMSEVFEKYKENFKFIEADIQNPLNFEENIDFIFNFASPASPPHYQKNAIATLRTNSEGTYQLLLLAEKKKARFIQASTSEVYGDPKEHPQRENYWGNVNPIGPRSCYDEAKRYAEALCMEFFWKKNVDVRIIRIFNTYGPRLDPKDGRIISNCVNQAILGEPITVYGDGLQTRSFQYVSDLIDAIDVVMFSGGKSGEVYNTGNPNEITVLDAVKLIKELTDGSSDIIFKDLPKDDPMKRKPDISKMKLLGWEPKVSFEEGLRKTIEWYKKGSK